MKKVLIAFDGKHFSEGAFDFVCQLNEIQPVLATGVFLPAIDYAELLYSLGGIGGPLYFQDIEFDETGIVEENIERFKSLCIKKGMEFRVHPDIEKHVISEIQLESRYADLLVIGNEHFYQNLGEETQDEYIENILHKSECPVVLVPEHYTFPENLILAYDGSEYSVFAIKQFAYLLPELTKLKALLVYAGTKDIPDISYIEELGARHYDDLNICKISIDPKKYFNTWMEEHGSSILVTGAFGRSALSEILRRSFITETIKEHRFPVFIAHR